MTRSFAAVALSAALLTNAKPTASPEENALATLASAHSNDAIVEERGRSRRVQGNDIEKRGPSYSPARCGMHFKRTASYSPKRCGPYGHSAVKREVSRGRAVEREVVVKRTPSWSPKGCFYKRSPSWSPHRCFRRRVVEGESSAAESATESAAESTAESATDAPRGRQMERTSMVVKRSPSSPWKKFYKYGYGGFGHHGWGHHGYGYGYGYPGFGYGHGYYGGCGFWKRDATDGGLDKRAPSKSAKQDLNHARGCARFRKRELAQEMDAANTQIAGEYSSELVEKKRNQAEAKDLEDQVDFDALARSLRERGISANELSAILDSVTA